jgi:hypothetical protein
MTVRNNVGEKNRESHVPNLRKKKIIIHPELEVEQGRDYNL